MRHGVFPRAADAPVEGTTTITLTRPLLIGMVTQTVDDHPVALAALLGGVSADDPAFLIVTRPR